MTLTEIIEEIPRLTLEEQWKLSDALAESEALAADDALWDEQFRRGLRPGGALAKLREEAIAEYERGEAEQWP